jgi:hypothetical protein
VSAESILADWRARIARGSGERIIAVGERRTLALVCLSDPNPDGTVTECAYGVEDWSAACGPSWAFDADDNLREQTPDGYDGKAVSWVEVPEVP